jgi:hypothetical protein
MLSIQSASVKLEEIEIQEYRYRVGAIRTLLARNRKMPG